MIALDYVELHTGLFLAGKNFGTKLDSKKFQGLKMFHDVASERIQIEWNDKVAYFHWMNAANIIPKDPKDIGSTLKPSTEKVKTHKAHPSVANISSAQVSTPMSHVFEGSGAGKTKQ